MRLAVTLTAILAAVAAATVLVAPASAAPRIAWARCDGAPANDPVRCGSISVPVAGAERTDVRVARLPAAQPRQRVGTLFFNPGGPGTGAVGYLASAKVRDWYFPKAIRDHFDVVAVEPRGTGTNAPLGCPMPIDRTVSRFPTDAGEVRALVASNRRFGESCVQAAGVLASHLDTRTVARDLDRVRAALGERQVSFLGVSYGTMLAQAYAEHFPHRVRAMVLDGVVDRSRDWRRLAADDAVAVEDGVTRLAGWCRTSADCQVRDHGVRPAIRAALRRADDGRVVDAGRRVRADEIAEAVNAGLNEPTLYPELSRGLRQVVDDGTFSVLAPFTNAANPDYAIYRPIICQDVSVPDPSALPAAARRVARLAPTLRGYSEFWDIAAGCAGWPTPARWQPHRWRVPASFPPPMLLSGAHDVATPRVWARSVHHALPGSRLVRWDGDGHAAWPAHDEAAVRAAARHLVEGPAPR